VVVDGGEVARMSADDCLPVRRDALGAILNELSREREARKQAEQERDAARREAAGWEKVAREAQEVLRAANEATRGVREL